MGWMESPEGLDKLRVDLPNHPQVPGETLWAKGVGGDLYELRNVPFHAYGLNFRDVVETATTASSDTPTIRRLRRPSGHRTVRLCFTEEALLEERIPTLLALRPHGATFEAASQSYFAVDIEPGGDHEAVCRALERWETQGLLTFETCEPRAPHSFDALPHPLALMRPR